MNLPHDFPDTLYDLARRIPYFVRNIADFTMDYEIGSGGFGVVYHARDKKTDQEVAVKQLKSEKLGAAFEKKYIQEIYTNAICNNRFVVRFIGFTLEEPYAIITEYQPKGTLNKIIYGSAAKTNPPSWLQLTVIALGLADGLSHIAGLNIVHRDIKASNVLLNNKYVPTITDFGLARFEDGSMMTKRNGTPMYMAPELFGKENYTKSVDVFAFGMLLYEMSELHVAYKNMNKEEVQKLAVHRTEYPKFTKNTPQPLRELIERCWGDPSQRPEMHEIFDAFASGAVSFKNPEKKKLKKLVEKMKEMAAERSEKAKTTPKQYVDVEAEIERIEAEKSDRTPKQAKAVNNEVPSDTVSWEILSKYNDPNFIPHFRSVVKKFQSKEDKETLFKLTAQVFTSENDALITQTLDCYRLVMLADNDFINVCYAGRLIPYLPSKSPGQLKASLEIIALLFAFRPELVDTSMATLLNYYIKQFPAEMVIISSFYVKQISDARAVTVLDELLKLANIYFNIESGVHLLTLFYTVIQENDVYSSNRSDYIRQIVVQFTKSPIPKVAACAYRILAHIHPKNDLDFPSVFEQLSVPEIVDPLLSVLIRYQEFPGSRRLCSKLIELSKTNPKAFDVLMLFAQSPANSKIVALDTSWYTSALPNITNTFKLLLLLYQNNEAKWALRNSQPYSECLKFIVQKCDIYVLTCLPPLLRRSFADANFFTELERNGFLEIFFQRSAESNDQVAMYNSITLVATIADICFVNSLIPEIGRLKGFMTNNQLIGSAITAIAKLSALRECKPHLIDMRDYFVSLLNYENYNGLAQSFLQNISQI